MSSLQATSLARVSHAANATLSRQDDAPQPRKAKGSRRLERDYAAPKGAADSGRIEEHGEGALTERIEKDVLEPMADFQDSSQEWRRLFSEFYGTFLLVLVVAGGGMLGRAFPDTISRTAAVVAPGLMVVGIINRRAATRTGRRC